MGGAASWVSGLVSGSYTIKLGSTENKPFSSTHTHTKRVTIKYMESGSSKYKKKIVIYNKRTTTTTTDPAVSHSSSRETSQAELL